ncbi:DUF4058 family protein [Oscillatoria sp. CS-180]|uniref:DUF4058 family protein n=1 Tax=Oscillatoria sp. CS-180 TaxID=3021720 RepID=UPI00232CD79C|nr:DUF4058 family protein [Oscillatoria sp. CS-180]MDB9529476.1 DUF4058 family protein [Oscillatoria sp. CS-180]
MPSPFPGMDPFLEQPAFWSSFHSRLVVAIADALAPNLRPRYYVEVETRTYWDTPDGELFVGIPDDVVLTRTQSLQVEASQSQSAVIAYPRPQEVTLPVPVETRERYLEIREVGTDAVITVIEVLSPKNKRRGNGRTTYETKRNTVLSSATHLVELDLLRADSPLPMQGANSSDYHVLVSRSDRRPQADLYALTVRDPLPLFPLPLKTSEENLPVDLPDIFRGVYDRAGYDLRIDYHQPIPPPQLSETNRIWINQLLADYDTFQNG